MDEEREKIDTLHRVETPEGVDLVLRVAGPLPRLGAFVIDFVVRVILWAAAALLLGALGIAGMGLLLIVAFVIEELYYVLFDVLYDGKTPGRQVMGLRVLNFDGTPIDWTSSVIRNLLRIADFLPIAFLGGLLSMLFAGQFRRLGDLAAGTLVVYGGNIRVSADLPLVRPEPPPVPLNLDEQRAVVSFAHRGPHLSRARAEELAELAGPLFFTENLNAGERVTRLYATAAWLLGRRPGNRRETLK